MQPDLQNTVQQTQQAATPSSATPFNVQMFRDNHRIHVEHGSLIFPKEQILPIHPAELAPANERELKLKIRKVYSLDEPSFFNDPKIASLSAMLSGFVPVSAAAKQARIEKEIKNLTEELATGKDPKVAQAEQREQAPFASVMKEFLKTNPDIPLEKIEFSKNAVGMTLVVQEALRQRGYNGASGGITTFLNNVHSPDGLASELSKYLKVDTQQFIQTAHQGGVNAVGKLLGLDDDYLKEVGQLCDYLPEKKFSANLINNWMVGRRMPGFTHAGVMEKADIGAWARVSAKVASARQAVGYNYTVPEPIQQTEQMVTSALAYLPPELSETLYRLGTEVVYSPATTLGPMLEEKGAPYGFHRRIHAKPDDIEGVYQLFLSGKGDAEAFVRLVAHESHHLVFPGGMSQEQITKVDQLANHDLMRLKALDESMEKWFKGNDEQKQEVLATLDLPEFAVNGKRFSEMMQGKDMLTFYTQVKHAADRLQITSDFYYNSGYSVPETRFLEVNSRYAELRYVRLREQPDMLQFIVPGLTESYDTVYLPHVQQQLQDLRQRDALKDQAMGRMTATALPPSVNPPAPVSTLPVTEPFVQPVRKAATPSNDIMGGSAELLSKLYQGRDSAVESGMQH